MKFPFVVYSGEFLFLRPPERKPLHLYPIFGGSSPDPSAWRLTTCKPYPGVYIWVKIKANYRQ